MRSSSSMMSLQAWVDSSRGSRLPDEDRQCTHARLHAYVSSQVRQIGASNPCSNCSISRGTTDVMRSAPPHRFALHRRRRVSCAPLLLIASSPSPLRGWGCPHCIVAGAHRTPLSVALRHLAPLLVIASSPSPLRGWGCPHCIVVGAHDRGDAVHGELTRPAGAGIESHQLPAG